MELKIKELCEARGINTAYELANQSKKINKTLQMPTAYRAFANDIKQFTIETLDALCSVLKCSPNDIFGFESAKNTAQAAEQSAAAAKFPAPGNFIAAPVASANDRIESARAEIAEIDAKLNLVPRRDTRELELKYKVKLPEIADDDGWLEPADVALITGKNPRTVRDMFNHKTRPLPRFNESSKGSLVKKSDLRAYLISGYTQLWANLDNTGAAQ